MAREADAGSGRREPKTAETKAKRGWEASGPRQPPARAMIRQAGVYGAELHAREGDTTIILPLDEDQLLGLIDEAMSGLRRARAGRRHQRSAT